VYPGSADGPAAAPSQILRAEAPGTLFAYSLASGDVDHDGDDDLLVGEPYYASSSGRALLYLAEGSRYRETPVWVASGPVGSNFGISVALRGDVNNDGFHDAVVGAYTSSFGPEADASGAAYLFLGSEAGLPATGTLLMGRHAGAQFGREVIFPGDLDRDGYDDLVVGAEGGSNGEDSEGIVEAYFGSPFGVARYGAAFVELNNMGANLGAHMARAGDLDGDGCADFFAGAIRLQQPNPREGAVLLYCGSPSRALRRLWVHVGGKAGSWYGSSVASGDFNGDGATDVLVSATAWDSPAGSNVGRVDLFLHER
jgi:hypothetical protein